MTLGKLNQLSWQETPDISWLRRYGADNKKKETNIIQHLPCSSGKVSIVAFSLD